MSTYDCLTTPFAVGAAPFVVGSGAASAFVARCARRASNNCRRVLATWTRNDDSARLVAREAVLLGELLRGDWTPRGYTLTEYTEVSNANH